ncbi:MAG: hypothetical protein PF574_01160 [Candidatus Delongbacteria bacterium]|jgi:hypothetical protein|nr:hypothetical protein [Candidatus Delongbacteria bacterium]
MKKFLIGFLIGVAGLAIFMTIYMMMYSQGVIEPFEAGEKASSEKVLIASQGSEYKNMFVKKIIEKLKNDSLFIKVIDVTEIEKENIDDFKAVLIINSIEMYDMQENAKGFLSSGNIDKVIMVATSGNGSMGPKDNSIDAVTTASSIETIDQKVQEVIKKIGDIDAY